MQSSRDRAGIVENVETVDNFPICPDSGVFFKRLSTDRNPAFYVDNVDSYRPSRVSPIFTTSPAPIVINRSPFMQFSNRKFSISSKLGK